MASTVRPWLVLLLGALVVAAALLWEASGRLAWIDPDLLPPLSKVFRVMGRLLTSSEFIGKLMFLTQLLFSPALRPVKLYDKFFRPLATVAICTKLIHPVFVAIQWQQAGADIQPLFS